MGRKRNKNIKNWFKNRHKNLASPPTTLAKPKTYTPYVRPARVPSKTLSRPANKTFTVTGATGFPLVRISEQAHGKMMALIAECEIEVGWMCSVYQEDNNDLYIEDIYVPLQDCTGTTTVLTEEGDEAMLMELLEAGKAKVVNHLKGWGHSHVWMGTSPSGVDEDQTDDFLTRNADYFVRLIGNKSGDLNVHVYLQGGMTILNNPDMVVAPITEDYSQWARDELDAKVSQRMPAYSGRASYQPQSQPYYGGNTASRYVSPAERLRNQQAQLDSLYGYGALPSHYQDSHMFDDNMPNDLGGARTFYDVSDEDEFSDSLNPDDDGYTTFGLI